MNKSYHELMNITSFEDRVKYLQLNGRVAESTFGSHRYLNQTLYRTPRWKQLRSHIIVRDNGCDLGHPDHLIQDAAYIHHINPISIDDILQERAIVFDPDNLITTTFLTHQAIHYSNLDLLPKPYAERKPNDTCPWR